MHWVDRGPIPEQLKKIHKRYTPRWVRYYRCGKGNKPSDSRWREFSEDLADSFGGLCAYCEERCRGEVDHFRPKSRYPHLVYSWKNWVFSCHDCNHAKGEKWPSRGYVDPCAVSTPARPEHFFTFDTVTGEILPKGDLSLGRQQKAQTMIDDLKLNEFHHLKKRIEWLRMVAAIIPGKADNLTAKQVTRRDHFSSRPAPYSSITRQWLVEREHYPD